MTEKLKRHNVIMTFDPSTLHSCNNNNNNNKPAFQHAQLT